eukprot:9214258-Ditylum_brightwellii.AAC.1
MVHQNSTPVRAMRASYFQGFNPSPQEGTDEWAEVGEGGKPEENDQDMMEEDKKKGEKQKLAVDASNNGTKGAEIKVTTSTKYAMRARGEKMVETKTIYKSKLRKAFNAKQGVERLT